MAGKLPPVGWLQQGSPVASLLRLRLGSGGEASPVTDDAADEALTDWERGLPRLASQGLVYALVLGPPLQLAVGDPAAFFGMLNVWRAAIVVDCHIQLLSCLTCDMI